MKIARFVGGGSPLDFITPEQFGAVGDGLADDTARLQQAVDAAKAQEKVLYLTGHYGVSAPINIHSAMEIVGIGPEGCSIRMLDAVSTGAPIRAVFEKASGELVRFRISGIFFELRRRANSAIYTNGACVRCKFAEVITQQHVYAGFYLNETGGTGGAENTIRDCEFYGGVISNGSTPITDADRTVSAYGLVIGRWQDSWADRVLIKDAVIGLKSTGGSITLNECHAYLGFANTSNYAFNPWMECGFELEGKNYKLSGCQINGERHALRFKNATSRSTVSDCFIRVGKTSNYADSCGIYFDGGTFNYMFIERNAIDLADRWLNPDKVQRIFGGSAGSKISKSAVRNNIFSLTDFNEPWETEVYTTTSIPANSTAAVSVVLDLHPGGTVFEVSDQRRHSSWSWNSATRTVTITPSATNASASTVVIRARSGVSADITF